MTWLVRFTPVETALGSILCMIWNSKRIPALLEKRLGQKLQLMHHGKAEVKVIIVNIVNIVCYDIKRNSSGECSDESGTKNAFNASPKLT